MLATVLFTDIVESTRIAEELGDRRWRELLRRHHAIVRRELKRYQGREIDTAGDGFLALFDSPAQAVRCAVAVSDAVRELGIEIRAGLHLGEVELTDGKAQGLGVHIGARIVAFGKPGDVLVSAPLKTTVAGSDLEFEPRGRRRLKGVEGTWQLYAVAGVAGAPRTIALEPEDAERRRSAIVAVPIGRRPRLMAFLLVAAVAVVAAVLVARRGPPAPPRSAGPPIGSLVLIDPNTNRVEQVIPEAFFTSVGQGVSVVPQVASGEGSVWVLAGPRVTAIDPVRGEQWRAIPQGFAFGDQGFDVGYRTVWLLVGNVVKRINPATGDFLPFTTHPDWSTFGGDLATGSGGVWVGVRGSIFRLDPQTAKIAGRIDLPGNVDHLAVGEGSLWVADELQGKTFKIDPTQKKPMVTIPVSGSLDEIVVGEGSVWILDSTIGTLSSIRLGTEEVRDQIRVGSDPTGVDVGLGSVWVAGGKEGIVTRINPQTGEQQQIRVGAPVSDITVDEDERVVWVTIS